METKQDLIDKITELLDIDNKIILLKREKDKLEKEKKAMSIELIDMMKKNEVPTINTKNNVIRLQITKTKPLGKKTLQMLLNNFYKDETSKAEELKNFIFDNIEERITEKINIKYTK